MTPSAYELPYRFRITAIENGVVKPDADHPLAIEAPIFEMKIQGIQNASVAEIMQAESIGFQSRVD